jgi:hypothetical protein
MKKINKSKQFSSHMLGLKHRTLEKRPIRYIVIGVFMLLTSNLGYAQCNNLGYIANLQQDEENRRAGHFKEIRKHSDYKKQVTLVSLKDNGSYTVDKFTGLNSTNNTTISFARFRKYQGGRRPLIIYIPKNYKVTLYEGYNFGGISNIFYSTGWDPIVVPMNYSADREYKSIKVEYVETDKFVTVNYNADINTVHWQGSSGDYGTQYFNAYKGKSIVFQNLAPGSYTQEKGLVNNINWYRDFGHHEYKGNDHRCYQMSSNGGFNYGKLNFEAGKKSTNFNIASMYIPQGLSVTVTTKKGIVKSFPEKGTDAYKVGGVAILWDDSELGFREGDIKIASITITERKFKIEKVEILGKSNIASYDETISSALSTTNKNSFPTAFDASAGFTFEHSLTNTEDEGTSTSSSSSLALSASVTVGVSATTGAKPLGVGGEVTVTAEASAGVEKSWEDTVSKSFNSSVSKSVGESTFLSAGCSAECPPNTNCSSVLTVTKEKADLNVRYTLVEIDANGKKVIGGETKTIRKVLKVDRATNAVCDIKMTPINWTEPKDIPDFLKYIKTEEKEDFINDKWYQWVEAGQYVNSRDLGPITAYSYIYYNALKQTEKNKLLPLYKHKKLGAKGNVFYKNSVNKELDGYQPNPVLIGYIEQKSIGLIN